MPPFTTRRLRQVTNKPIWSNVDKPSVGERVFPKRNSDELCFLITVDFTNLRRFHTAQNTLQGSRVLIIYVYESETLNVSFKPNTLHASMTVARLQKLLGPARWDNDVFTCLQVIDRDSAEIELMNAKGRVWRTLMPSTSLTFSFIVVTTEWLADAGPIERDLSLIIRPLLDSIDVPSQDEPEDAKESEKRPATPLVRPQTSPVHSPVPTENPNLYYIKPDWRLILTHPTFGNEYRKYIRKYLSLSVCALLDDFPRRQLAYYRSNCWFPHWDCWSESSKRISAFYEYVRSKVCHSRSDWSQSNTSETDQRQLRSHGT